MNTEERNKISDSWEDYFAEEKVRESQKMVIGWLDDRTIETGKSYFSGLKELEDKAADKNDNSEIAKAYRQLTGWDKDELAIAISRFVEISKLNADQKAVLDWLEEQSFNKRVSPFMIISALHNSKDLPEQVEESFVRLSKHEEFQVLSIFGNWGE